MTDPGWYTDPADPTMRRWWDGAQWAPTAASPPAQLKRASELSKAMAWLIALGILFLMVGGSVISVNIP